MAAQLDLIVFDLGGVLVHTARDWTEACRLAGRDVLRQTTFLASLSALGDRYQLGLLSTDDYLRGVSEASGAFYSPRDVERIHHSWSQGQVEGVERVFDVLDATKLDVAVLSNTNEAHWQRLAALHDGPPEYPIVLRSRYRFASHLLGVAKPDPRAFAAVTEGAGVIPDRVLFFDDLEENVRSAKSFGWNAEQINPEADTPAQILRALTQFGITCR